MFTRWLDSFSDAIIVATPLVTSSVEITATWVIFLISPRIWRTWTVACLDCSASDLTLPATTANPLPCSPGCDASIAALSRQDVGLVGDVGDGGDDVADRLGLVGQTEDRLRRGLDPFPEPVERGDRLLDRQASRLADGDGLLGDFTERLGGAGGLRRRLRDLIDGGDGLRHGGGLFLGAAGLLGGAGKVLGGGRGQLTHRRADRLQKPLDPARPFCSDSRSASIRPRASCSGEQRSTRACLPSRRWSGRLAVMVLNVSARTASCSVALDRGRQVDLTGADPSGGRRQRLRASHDDVASDLRREGQDQQREHRDAGHPPLGPHGLPRNPSGRSPGPPRRRWPRA